MQPLHNASVDREFLFIHAQYWKLVHTAERRFGRKAISRGQRQKTKMLWKECEYNPSMKFLLKFFGSCNRMLVL